MHLEVQVAVAVEETTLQHLICKHLMAQTVLAAVAEALMVKQILKSATADQA
jgi:hypothetical protein